MVMFLIPVWIAFLFGLMIGWAWKPKWVTFGGDKFTSCVWKFLDSSLPSSPCRSVMSPMKGVASFPSLNTFMEESIISDEEKKPSSVSPLEYDDCSASRTNEDQANVTGLVTEEDLAHLYQLVEMKDGGPLWIQMMDRSTPTVTYQAWRRDLKNGRPQYRSRTVFEDALPEMVRDFFWDDEFRAKWDDMLSYYATIDECPATGSMLVHWIRKFPFFCSDREYVIARRMWESDGSYYCVTKGVPCISIPRREKPRRVDLYHSSWYIRAVESRTGDSKRTSCEVIFFHHEDMGIPWEIAKLGVRHGMWGTVKKISSGFRAYQNAVASGAARSRFALMAQIYTKISPDFLKFLGGTEDSADTEAASPSERPHSNIPKLIIFGGVVILACSIDRGLLPKALIFGVARKFANIGKR